eukprot:jgi/Picre1/35591/NNA_003052.t1
MVEEFEEREAREKEEAMARMEDDGWTVVRRYKGRKKNTDEASGITVGAVAPAAAQEIAKNGSGVTLCTRISMHLRSEKRGDQSIRYARCHFLRTWRQKVVAQQDGKKKGELDLGHVIRSMPPSTYEPCLRELASIYRCDLTCVCSPREIEILDNHYGVDEDRLVEAAFFNGPSKFESSGDNRSFGERQDAMMIGNFRHPPNADSVQWACRVLWPASGAP